MTVRYVSKATGNDGNSGLTPALAWASINRATSGPESQPGDGIGVLPAASGAPYAEEVICARPGALGRQISLFSTVARGALIRPPAGSYSAIRLVQPYWDVSGFDVSYPGGAGVDNTWNGSKSHHLSIHDMFVHDCGSNGIGLAWADWWWLYRNEIARCALTSPYQTSNVTFYQPQDNSGDHSPGWRIVAEQNWSHDALEAQTIVGNHTDGNGLLLLDDGRNTQASTHQTVPYQFGALARWNLLTGNGGTGGHSYLSDNATFIENTLANNNRDLLDQSLQQAGLLALFSNNVKMIGNVSVADSSIRAGNFAIGFYQSTGMMDGNMDFDRAKPGKVSILNPAGIAITDQVSGLDPQLGVDWMPRSPSARGLGAPLWSQTVPAVATLPPDVRATLAGMAKEIGQIQANYPAPGP